MTERGLPIVGGAPACPFVAFEDDRDERATSPDHRHRCYAEAPPAPRALAHQEAYCLSSAFPVCPTFQDWARREAARARTPDLPPAEEDEDDAIPPFIDDRPPRRGSREAWAAPPPWLRGAGAAGPPPGASPPTARPTDHDDAEGAAEAAAATTAGAAGGLSGSFADRLASDRRALDPGPAEPGDWDDEEPRRGMPPPREPYVDDRSRDLLGPTDEEEDEEAPIARSPRRRERLEAGSDPIEGQRERDVAAPAWERPRRLEAYPTLRSRRLSSSVLTSIGLGLLALLIAAAALFFLPQLLNLGGAPGASPTPSIAGSVTPSGETAAPSQVPTATPFLYTVKPGDNFFKIATKFGVDFIALVDANKDTHPNPDILNVGDVLIIPTSTPTGIPGAAASP